MKAVPKFRFLLVFRVQIFTIENRITTMNAMIKIPIHDVDVVVVGGSIQQSE